MSIFGILGKVFGYSGDEAEAFGAGFSDKGATTFTASLNKSMDKFDKRVDDYAKLDMANDLETAKLDKAEFGENLKGIKKFSSLGFSPIYAAAIYNSPAATQKIMIDAANATDSKKDLDSLWKVSNEVSKEMTAAGNPVSQITAAKLIMNNQIKPEKDYSSIPETQNMMTRLGFNANLRDSIKDRVEGSPKFGVDYSTDSTASIPTGGPSTTAVARAKALNAKDKTASRNTIADSTIVLSGLESKGFNVTSNISELATGLEAGNQLHKLLNFGIDSNGKVVANSMYLSQRKTQLYSNDDKIKTTANSQGVRLFANKGFITKMKKLFKSSKLNEADNTLAERILDSLKERYSEAAVRDLVQIIK